MEPAHKAHFYQLRLELAQKHLSLTDTLWSFSSEYTVDFITFVMDKSCFNALNYLWVTTLSPRVLKNYFDWYKHTNPFLGC